jgi:N-acetyl-anhydromuramyl-L-alanine amidase AmpD
VSAHLCIDNNSIVQCVFDNDIAFAAPGANHNGIHLELAGFARQTREEWLDPFSILVLENAANASAQYCLKYNIPPKHLANDELEEGQKGIVGHVNVSQVFKKSTHTDPGAGFPWDIFKGSGNRHSI